MGPGFPPLILAAGECFLFLVLACLASFYSLAFLPPPPPLPPPRWAHKHVLDENRCCSGHFGRRFSQRRQVGALMDVEGNTCAEVLWPLCRGGRGGGPRAAEDALLINSGVLSLYCCANQAQMWTPQLQKIIRAVLTADASREGGRGLTSWRGGAGGGGGGHHFNCSGRGSNPNMYTRESESSLSCQPPETEIFMMVA